MALPVAWLDHDWFLFVRRISTVTLGKGDISNLRVDIQKGFFFPLNINSACFLLFFQWALLRRVWLHLLSSLCPPLNIFTHC